MLATVEVAAINLQIRHGQLRAGLRLPELRFLLLRLRLDLGSVPEAQISPLP